MYFQPYETTLLKVHPVAKLVGELEVQFIEGNLSRVDLSGDRTASPEEAEAIYEVLPGNNSVGAMLAPLLINTRQGRKIVIDSRTFKRDRRDGPPVVASPNDYRFAVREAVLTWLWNELGQADFSQIGTLPVRIYARWIADGVGRRLALSPIDQIRVSVMAAYYYLISFRNDEDQYSDEGKVGLASLISRSINVPSDMVLNLIHGQGKITNLQGFVDALKGLPEIGLRMESLTPGIIYTLLGGSWYGARSKTIVATALEFPPTFLTMVYTAFNDRSYHSCYFAKMAVQADRHHQARDLTVAISHLTRGFIDA